jgi:hypothetical protein
MNLRSLALATALTAAVASPALAMGPHARSEAVQQRLQASQMYNHPYYYRYREFGPGDVAAGVIGGAIGTAGAIAGAPFGYDTYYDGPYPYAW